MSRWRSWLHSWTDCNAMNLAYIAGFAFNTLTRGWTPEINTTITHLRDVLGDQTYESLAREGETMITAEMVTYAYDQIDQARTELNAVAK